MSRGPRSRHPGTGLPSQPPAGSLRLPLHCAPLHRLSGKCPSPGNPPTTKPYLCHQGLYFHCPPHPRTHGLRARGGVLGRPRDTRTHTWRLLPSQRKLGQLRQPGPHRPRGSRPRENNTRRHQDEDPGPGAGVGVLRSRSAPRPGHHKALSGHGLRKGRTQTVHSRPVRGARGGRRGPVPSHPHPHAPRVLAGMPAGSQGAGSEHRGAAGRLRQRCPQDTVKGLDAGPHLPAGQRPAKPADAGARPGSPSTVLSQPCDLASSSVSSEPCAWGVRCRAPGTHLLGTSTGPEPPGAPAATPQRLGAGFRSSRGGGGRAPFPADEHPWEAPPGLGAGTRQPQHRQCESGTPGEPGRNTAPRRGLQHRSHPPSAINKPV